METPDRSPSPQKVDEDEGIKQEHVSVFAEETRYQLELYWRLAEGFERRAATVLGFSGVILSVLIAIRPDQQVLGSPTVKGVATALLGFGAGLLVLAAGLAMLVLRPRRVRVPTLGQLREEWHGLGRDDIPRPPMQIRGTFVDVYIKSPGTLGSWREDARVRGQWLARSGWALVGATVSVAASLLVQLVTGGAHG